MAVAVLFGRRRGSVPTTSALPSEDTSPIVRRNVDGALRIGVWLPTSGPAAALGSPLAAGVELAVQEINEAGGVNGRMVQVANRDEGGDPATAYQALRELLEQEQVDVIVGPSSSRVALGAIDTLAAAHVVDCSPTTSAIDLGGRPRQRLLRAHHRLRSAGGRGADQGHDRHRAHRVRRALPRRRLRPGLRQRGAAVLPTPAGERQARPLRPDRRALQRPRRAGAGRRGRGHRGGRDGPDRRQRPGRPRAERRQPAAHLRVRDRRPPQGRPGDDDRPAPARGLRRHPGRVADGGPGPLVLRGRVRRVVAGHTGRVRRLRLRLRQPDGPRRGRRRQRRRRRHPGAAGRRQLGRVALRRVRGLRQPAPPRPEHRPRGRVGRPRPAGRRRRRDGLVRPVHVRRRRARRHAAGPAGPGRRRGTS